ncbi:gag/pol protein [Cucumis melo var. makuwa]|uniref:Gag/pol protein n=1 Tax=Cucumis melo var. makuwa TaxID=1194695 RepID=A0A5A7UHV8_CUCMM|nr:gag/pol protein [Cucumis melo var. makuwa]TYJ96585.1 gag/pol protein [Cucumis melo var. makuwa]
MKEGTFVREHVLDMMMHFNIAEVSDGVIDEANHVSFILESLPKSFIPFQTNVSLNKIEFNLTTLLNELQCFQNLTMGKGKEVEANVATTKRKFSRGASSKSKVGPSKPNRNIEKKGKGKTPQQNKENSSWKRLSEDEITLEVGTGEMVSAKVVGDLKLFFNDRYILLKDVLYAPQMKRKLISISSETQNKRQKVSSNAFLWHLSLGHINLNRIGRLVKNGLLSQLEDNSLPPCDSCLEGKMTKSSFTGKGLRAKIPLELVHSDL